MKFKLFITLITVLFSGVLSSCDDDVNLDDKENTVIFKVYSNTPQVPIRIQGANPGGLTIKDYWEKEFVTKMYGVQLTAYCDDPETLITGEVYVNGKLRSKKEGNSYVHFSINLKGDVFK